MFENPRRGRLAINFTTYVPKILDLILSSEQIFSENWRWVPLVLNEQRHILQLSEALGSALPLREAGTGFVGVLPLPSTHFLIFQKTQHCTRKQRSRLLSLFSREINHRMYQIYKEDGVVNRFLTARRHFWTPWSERTHYMENGQSVFFFSPHLPYVFGHVRLTGLLLRCSYPTLNQFGGKKSYCFAV